MRNPAYTVPNPPLPNMWATRYVFVNVSLSINANGWPEDVEASDAPAKAPDDADGAPDAAVVAPVIDTEISSGEKTLKFLVVLIFNYYFFYVSFFFFFWMTRV